MNIDFAKHGGFVPAIVQHADTGAVLMQGWMTAEALQTTLERRRVVFFSRSRQRLWEKGEISGHHLELVALHPDCDQDALLVLARPHGPVCHLGTRTCFGDAPRAAAESLAFLASLERIVASRIADRPEASYTARLVAEGTHRVAQKVGEEGVETALAGVADDPARLVREAADLLYHLVVLLQARGVALTDVVRELEGRHKALP